LSSIASDSAPVETPAEAPARRGWVALAREHRKLLGIAVAVVVLAILVLIDHSGPAAVVEQADQSAASQAAALQVTASGDPRLSVRPGSAHAVVDGAGLASVALTLVSTADTTLVVDADGRLLGDSQLVQGFVSGGITVPAHGTAVLRLSGMPPFSTVTALQLTLHAVAAPPAG
jgi:hypothetical protein